MFFWIASDPKLNIYFVFLLACLNVSHAEIFAVSSQESVVHRQFLKNTYVKNHWFYTFRHVTLACCLSICTLYVSGDGKKWFSNSVFLHLAASLSCLCWYYKFKQANPVCIFNALLLPYKATTQECSGQWIIVNQINMVLISLAGLPSHNFHRGAEYKMTSANSKMDCIQHLTLSC